MIDLFYSTTHTPEQTLRQRTSDTQSISENALSPLPVASNHRLCYRDGNPSRLASNSPAAASFTHLSTVAHTRRPLLSCSATDSHSQSLHFSHLSPHCTRLTSTQPLTLTIDHLTSHCRVLTLARICAIATGQPTLHPPSHRHPSTHPSACLRTNQPCTSGRRPTSYCHHTRRLPQPHDRQHIHPSHLTDRLR